MATITDILLHTIAFPDTGQPMTLQERAAAVDQMENDLMAAIETPAAPAEVAKVQADNAAVETYLQKLKDTDQEKFERERKQPFAALLAKAKA